MAEIIPADTHVQGDAGHLSDHNNMADVLTRLAITLAQASAPGATFTTAQGAAALAALDTMTSGHRAGASDMLNVKAAPYLAAGNGTTDDTTALTNAISALNAGTGGGLFFPYGTYLVTSALPAITRAGITITGDGWAQNTPAGSRILAAIGSWTAPMLTLSGEDIQLSSLLVDGGGIPATLVSVTAPAFLTSAAMRAPAASGICCSVASGATGTVLNGCWINAANAVSSTAVQLAAYAIITGCRPENAAWGIVVASGATDSQIMGNHISLGAAAGQNCIWVNGSSARVNIVNNRFNAYVRAAVQITPTSNVSQISITGNVFYSTVMTSGYPLIGFDTSTGADYQIVVADNTGYASGTLPTYFLAATTQAGAAATNPASLSVGTQVTGNCAYAPSGFYGPSVAPTKSTANLITTNGTSFSDADAAGPPPTGRLVRNGEQLTLNGKPYRMIGFDMYFACITTWNPSYGWGNGYQPATGNNLSNDLAAMQAAAPGINTLRVFFLQQYANHNGVRDWSAMDNVLRMCALANVKVIAALQDWHFYELNGSSSGYDSTWFGGGYQTTFNSTYETESYWAWVQEVVAHYAGDPRIAVWELLNEPNGITTSFASTVSAKIKQIDPGALVSCGEGGDIGTSFYNLSTIDFASYHYYTDYGQTNYSGSAASAAAAGKPMYMGENGFDKTSPLSTRANEFSSLLSSVFAISNIVGFCIWDWNPGASNDTFDVESGDPAIATLQPYTVGFEGG